MPLAGGAPSTLPTSLRAIAHSPPLDTRSSELSNTYASDPSLPLPQDHICCKPDAQPVPPTRAPVVLACALPRPHVLEPTASALASPCCYSIHTAQSLQPVHSFDNRSLVILAEASVERLSVHKVGVDVVPKLPSLERVCVEPLGKQLCVINDHRGFPARSIVSEVADEHPHLLRHCRFDPFCLQLSDVLL
eukprot:2922327-Prymnesium_polylepis.1